MKIKKITDNIAALVIPDNYERAMLFCRVQEFYESPGLQFRNKKFCIWDYFRWYSKKTGCFSYPKDFVGYNLPLIVAKKCYEINDVQTPYDQTMKDVIDSLWENGKRMYLIGVDSLSNSVFDHELAHAFYYCDLSYKNKMDSLTRKISATFLKRFKKNLKEMGYCPSVFKDEVQAYMSTELNKRILKGIPNKRELHKKYKEVFKKYRKSSKL